MTERARAVYNTVNRRKLLQAEADAVQVSDIVTVIQNGTGNFTTINEAIAAAPNKTDGSNGYFLIYVTAGLYEEYVEVPKNKRYVMMIGDGINQTIITGNRSVVDGWTTFNSATFSQSNEVTAQGRTDPNQNIGTVIHGCTIRPADDLATSNYTVKTYLGRPWKEYSRTVVMQTYIDGFLEPTDWNAWSGDFALSTLYYAEYNNTGPGSNTTNRVTWPGYHVINATDASNFTVTNFLVGEGWIGQTGVPFMGGLIA